MKNFNFKMNFKLLMSIIVVLGLFIVLMVFLSIKFSAQKSDFDKNLQAEYEQKIEDLETELELLVNKTSKKNFNRDQIEAEDESFNSGENPSTNTKKTGSKIKSLDEIWNLYINYDLGFQIKVPKKSNGSQVKIIEEGKIVYLVDTSAEMWSNQDNVEQARKKTNVYEKINGVSFAIFVEEVKNDQELENFLQKVYYPGCEIGSKKPFNNNPDIFSVRFKTYKTQEEWEEKCHINGRFIILYSPNQGKVATWGMGQANTFKTKINGQKTTLDDNITNSFDFID
ncbi:MAG: hypothetical protein GF335_04615 [Candidatus Moranbacteria bacterium]|nr:hypothetical protein [Candidatus Moranbacteria bacterium]